MFCHRPYFLAKFALKSRGFVKIGKTFGDIKYEIFLFSIALEHLQTTTHTLILAHSESSFSHKISCPSHLVKELGVGLYSDPTPIYFYLF
jgi:hypothetical protein